MHALIEISSYSVQWAIDAQQAGANRIELCDNIYEGGTTPSYASIKLARKYLDIELFILIRPRGGDFLYSDLEFETMKSDIEIAKKLGADGLVFGLLKSDGSIDKERTKELVELSKPLPVTFHRAFDVVKDPFQALEDIIDCSCSRILTSGQKSTAYKGIPLLKQLIDKAGTRIIIMPGSGINSSNILEIKQKANASELHLSAKKTIISPITYVNKDVSFNTINKQPVPEYMHADMSEIAKVCKLVV